MFRKITLILLSINLLAAKPAIANTQQKDETSFVETAAWCTLGAGAIAATVMFAPVVVPAVIAGAQGAAAAVATQAAVAGGAATGTVIQGAAAAPIAMQANMVIYAGTMTKEMVYKSPEEKLKALKDQESLELEKAKLDLVKCVEEHKVSGDRNSFDAPVACDELLMLVAMIDKNKES